MVKPTSFISEHSAEFALVPAAVRALSAADERVVPLYFWKSREGSSMGVRCGPEGSVRVAAMFARRPKVLSPDQDHVLVKLNDMLFAAASFLAEVGIPTFAGVPLASSMAALACHIRVAWLGLLPTVRDPSDVEIVINAESGRCEDTLPPFIQALPTDDELREFVAAHSERIPWRRAPDAMRGNPILAPSVTAFVQRFRGGFFGPSYKPVYLVLL